MKSMEKSICLECGKNFTSKKGLKQHVMRMHVQKPIKANISITLDEEEDVITESGPMTIERPK